MNLLSKSSDLKEKKIRGIIRRGVGGGTPARITKNPCVFLSLPTYMYMGVA